MTTIEDVMNYAREAGNMERRMCIGKAQGFDVRNAYNELRAAIEQYAAEWVAEMQADFDRTCLDLQDYADRVIAERDALQADAARYRWLRDMDEDPVCSLAAMWTDCKGSALSISKKVDAAVDAARGKNTT